MTDPTLDPLYEAYRAAQAFAAARKGLPDVGDALLARALGEVADALRQLAAAGRAVPAVQREKHRAADGGIRRVDVAVPPVEARRG